jgi:hypothetical protein
LIPTKIEPCELRVDFRLRDYVDLTGWSGPPRDHALDPLIDALGQKVGRAPHLSRTNRICAHLPGSSPSVPSLAERDWDCYRIGETEDVAIIKAFIKRYGKSEPLWDTRARQRLATVEALAAERLKKMIGTWKPPQFKR